MVTIQELTDEYHRLKARATQLEAALPNARDIGLAAYSKARAEFDKEFSECVRGMRRIENEIAQQPL